MAATKAQINQVFAQISKLTARIKTLENEAKQRDERILWLEEHHIRETDRKVEPTIKVRCIFHLYM